MATMRPIIIWFRQDLRLSDNPALFKAAQENVPIVFLYIDTPTSDRWSLGAASRWWLKQSLTSLASSLMTSYGAFLNLEKGDPLPILLKIIKTTHAQAVYWD